MTERSPGAPDPAEPARPHDFPAAGGGPSAPADLNAVRRTDAIIDAIAARRVAGSADRAAPPDDADPAVRLLSALVSDVDDPAPPVPAGPGPRRRGPRTIVALADAGAVLASTGVAAAGSGVTDRSSAAAPTTPGPAGTAEPPRDAEDDSVAATHVRPAPSAPPAPRPSERVRPTTAAPAATPDPERRVPDPVEREFKERLERFLESRQEQDARPSSPVSREDDGDGAEPPTLRELRDQARDRWNRLTRD
ncbi:hypothetical protein [Actinomadura sediminis]|uniref:Uncharacterized protein n=1 Tax=Actinomadura sediminis TaxID=1038904 RepID=A0ABW3ENF5_9ACTN